MGGWISLLVTVRVSLSNGFFLKIFSKDSIGGRCRGLPVWSFHPAGFILKKKKKKRKEEKKLCRTVDDFDRVHIAWQHEYLCRTVNVFDRVHIAWQHKIDIPRFYFSCLPRLVQDSAFS